MVIAIVQRLGATTHWSTTMPVVTIQVPAGSLSAQQKSAMISKVTDAVLEAEGYPQLRPATTVLIQEIVDGGWGRGGEGKTLAEMKAAIEKAR
jgi:4-oxalocrotonate tautomerase